MKNMEIKIELNEEYAAEYGNGKAKESNVIPFPTSSDAAAADQIEVVDAETLTDPKNVAQRDEYIERIDVLTKVKGLLLLPHMEMATTKQVAEYYEVSRQVLTELIKRHGDELKQDGMYLAKYSEIKSEVNKGNLSLLEDGVSYRGTYLFPKRAILRVGLLLRDSEIAKEVRSQLLNIEEAATNGQRTAAIDQEDALLLAMIKAKDPITSAAAIAEYSEFQNARIKKAEEAAEKYEGKANKFDQLIDQSNLLTMTNVGKSYLGGVSAQELNRFLIDRGILYKKQIDGVRLYRKGYEKYFRVVTYDIGHRTLKVTIDGALFIADLYKESIK
ncbi:phage antirepressor KilAC domain-containing protein [Bacillus thuringiensis]